MLSSLKDVVGVDVDDDCDCGSSCILKVRAFMSRAFCLNRFLASLASLKALSYRLLMAATLLRVDVVVDGKGALFLHRSIIMVVWWFYCCISIVLCIATGATMIHHKISETIQIPVVYVERCCCSDC